ncbi:MAG: alanyl-tRNA editing protein [Candidatus Methanomethylicia archaeon]
MTEKLYWLNPYEREFDARVLSISGRNVVLDRTCFYPRGGGQPGDTGEINGIRVVDTVKDEEENIIHILDGEPNFKVGDIVHGRIDWERRYRIMRLHTAIHVISAVLVRNFGNVLFTGSQIYEDRARMDFNLEKLDELIAKQIEEKTNETIKLNLPVTAEIISREDVEKNPSLKRLMDTSKYEKFTTFRIVRIGDIDMQLDGGTHVRNTSEIGMVRIVKRENKGKNNRRITIVLE